MDHSVNVMQWLPPTPVVNYNFHDDASLTCPLWVMATGLSRVCYVFLLYVYGT